MKTKSTYSLLVNSEEKNRSIVEGAVYVLLIGCMAFSMFSMASQSVTMPNPGTDSTKNTEIQLATTPAPQPPLIAARG